MKLCSLILSALCFAQSSTADPLGRDRLAVAMASHRPVIAASLDGAGNFEIESSIEIKAPKAEALVDIGSITKTVTAITALHLIENMGLSTQSSLAELLPSVPKDKASITLHQLLTHTSGLLKSTGDDAEILSRSGFLGRVLSAPLETTPGAVHSYSNAGYSLLAAIIEVQSNMGYEDYLLEHVLPDGAPPIGYAAVYTEAQSIVSGRHWLTAFQRQPIAEASWGGREPGWNLVGNGGLVSTAEGFVTLWSSFIGGKIVSHDLVKAALTPHIDEGNGDTFYGYGLVVEPRGQQDTVYWHDGGNEIFSAEWRYETGSGVTLFTAGRGDAAFEAMNEMMSNF